MPDLRIASNNARAKPATVLDEGVRRLDSVSKSAQSCDTRGESILCCDRLVMPLPLMDSLTSKIGAAPFEQLLFMARNLHSIGIGRGRHRKDCRRPARIDVQYRSYHLNFAGPRPKVDST